MQKSIADYKREKQISKNEEQALMKMKEVLNKDVQSARIDLNDAKAKISE